MRRTIVPRLDGRLLTEERVADVDVPWCECARPSWQQCRPLFPSVRECGRCGGPDREQLGRWPASGTVRAMTTTPVEPTEPEPTEPTEPPVAGAEPDDGG
jgi:hypothetical protein